MLVLYLIQAPGCKDQIQVEDRPRVFSHARYCIHALKAKIFEPRHQSQTLVRIDMTNCPAKGTAK